MRILLIALNAHYMHTNLAVRYLKESLSQAGMKAEIFENHINTPYRRLLHEIAAKRPDVIGFSCYIFNISMVTRLCGALKRALPDTKIILGGPEVSYESEALVETGIADYIITGEGERPLTALISAIRSGATERNIPGVTGMEDGKLFVCPPSKPMEPDDWPDAYKEGIAKIRERILYVETSRGCPYRCSYCLSSRSGGVFGLDAKSATERLLRLAEGGAKLIKLVDRTFNYDPARAREIFDALIRHAGSRENPPTYHFEIGAHLIDDETIRVLSRAPKGLFQFEIGIQSTDGKVLENISRPLPTEAVLKNIRAVLALSNISVHVDLIAGLPGESMESFQKSIDSAGDLNADMLQLGFLKVLKGSEMRKKAESLSIVYEPEAPYEVISTPGMSFDDLSHLKDIETAIDWYYNSGRYKTSMNYLRAIFTFSQLFSRLAAHLRETGVFSAERGERARAEALIMFGSQVDDGGVFGHLLCHDLLTAGRRRDLPAAFSFTETEDQRAVLRQLFRPVRGQSVRTYPFDMEEYLLSGRIVPGKFDLVYGT